MSASGWRWQRLARGATRVALVLLAASVVLGLGIGVATLVTGDPPGDGSWSLGAVVAATVAGGAGWPILRRWSTHAGDRLLHGGRRTPDEVVRAFGRRASRDTPDDELLVQLAEALVRVLRSASAEVWLVNNGGRIERTTSIPFREPAELDLDEAARRVLSGGGVVGRAWLEMWCPALVAEQPTGEVRVAPATHAGVLLGLVVVSRLAGAHRFQPDEDASLAELGGRLGVVLHNRQLDSSLRSTLADLRRTNDELRASRVRLVATADAERRRLERDLHDGAQQHLVALAVNLRLAADEVQADPARGPGVFAALGHEVREAINELRTLAHGIYPPVLMDAGLVDALRAAARRSTSPVTVTSDGVGRYPADVEAAAYFCCVEALQNAAKHAPGAAVRLHIAEEPADHPGGVRQLCFRVDDDGPGIGGGAIEYGHGLGNMLDRMVAAGGMLDVGSSPSGGARVTGRVPVGGR